MPDTSDPSGRRRSRLVVGGIVGFILIALLGIGAVPASRVLGSLYESACDDTALPFDREGWITDSRPFLSRPVRERMAGALVDERVLIGSTADAVRERLGGPDSVGETLRGPVWRYVLARRETAVLFLQLEFGGDGRVEEAAVGRDS